jgi:putative peptidoglycan lipid II flippase
MRGGLVVGAGILAGNLTGFVRVGLTAWFLGTGVRADALAVAVGPIDTLNTALVNTMLVSLVPMLMLRGEAGRVAIFRRTARVLTWIIAGITGGVFAFAPALISALGPGLAPAQHQEAAALLRVISPAVFCSGLAAIYSALLYTERRFLAPALYQACVNGGMILGAMALWRFLGVFGFAAGYTCGALLQLVLTWVHSADLRHSAAVESSAIPLSEILGRPAMFLLYAGLISANVLATRAFATHAGPGIAAAFDYCLRCLSSVVAYLVYPVANSLLPEIARLRGENRAGEAWRLTNRSVALMSVAAVAACAIGIAIRQPVIALLFQRGSFTTNSTQLVSSVFVGFAPAIVGWALMDLMSRCFFALDRWKIPTAAATVPLCINLAVLSVTRELGPGYLGVGMSAGMAAGFAVLFFGAQLRKRSAIVAEEPVSVA